MTRAAEYRAQLEQLADEAGFPEGDPMRVGLMLVVACGWLEMKDEYLIAAAERRRALGLVAPCGEAWSSSPAGESQNVTALRGREGHSHAERGAR